MGKINEILEELAKEILSEAKAQGADHAHVNISDQKSIGTRFGENHITQNVSEIAINFVLKTQIGDQVGIYSGSRPNSGTIKKMVSDAITLTKYSAPDKTFPGFIEDQLRYRPQSGKIIEYSQEEIAAAIENIIEKASSVSDKISAVAGNLHYNAHMSVSLNTNDVIAFDDSSNISSVINVAASESENEARSTGRSAGVKIEDLKLEKLVESVADKAKNGLNQQEMDTGRYDAILGHGSMATLWMFIAMATSAESLITHTSFLKDKIGEQIFDKKLTVTDEVENPHHYASRRFDSEMVPSDNITYIENGVLKEYAYNRRSAKILGSESNGRNASGFLGEMPLFYTNSMNIGTKSEEELIESIDNGIYVTNLFYANFINAPEGTVTGLTKDGLFKIEKGEIVSSLRNFRFSDSLLSIFNEIEPGNNVLQTGGLFGGGIILPSVRVSNFNLSSKGKH
jgi:predicted Zn-dependent protease